MRHLSQYILTPADVRALRLTDGYSLHRVVYGLFDDVRKGDHEKRSGILFVDKGARQGKRQVLILSDRLPHPVSCGRLETRDLSDSYLHFKQYCFEIVINPVRRDNASGKIVPVRGAEATAQWFQDKSLSWGFSTSSVEVVNTTVECFSKGQGRATIARATLTGTLEVTDRTAFIHAVYHGIGRAKAFGCGLLQIIPSN